LIVAKGARPGRVEQATEKLGTEGGGGFNPRIRPTERARALAPDRRIPPVPPQLGPFSAACKAPCTDTPRAAAFVLAGGKSSRMGQDKALVRLGGRPLIEYALATLREAGLVASIAGASSEMPAYAPVVKDAAPGLGPLSGVCNALASTSSPCAVFLSVDLPLLPASLVAYMLHHAQIAGAFVTLISVNGFPQTFPAVVDRAVLPVLQAELDAGHLGCFSAFKTAAASLASPLSVLPVEMLAQSGHVAHPQDLPAAFWFLNVNTPSDLKRAEGMLTRKIA